MLDFVSSVRFGVFQLCVLVFLAMVGMVIMQQNVEGFEAWYFTLMPASKVVGNWLGIFDIYHTWYFNLLLLSLSLNIVLASIDRFPSAWSYIVKPKTKATTKWLLARDQHDVLSYENESVDDVVARVEKELKSQRYKTILSVEAGVTTVFGERGKINRLGAYIVHVALLTLFLGNFVFYTTSRDADVQMIPGAKTDQIQELHFAVDNAAGFKKDRFNVKIPFTLECTDIQQRLIDEKGGIDVSNTLDWRTELKIDDPEYGVSVQEASLNKPLFYRGYRFFQAQTIPIGHARKITLDLTPEAGGDVTKVEIARNGSTTLTDGTKVDFTDFQPDFVMGKDGQPDTRSGDYNMPAAILDVTPPGGQRTRVFAMPASVADNIPMGKAKLGYKWRLGEFEKAPMAHVLAIKYDPFDASIIAWYWGGFGLVGSLMFVFFFSHKRIWAQVMRKDDGTVKVVLAGDANRNQIPFGDKFKNLVDKLRKDK